MRVGPNRNEQASTGPATTEDIGSGEEAGPDAPVTCDDLLLDVAREIPGFAGFYLDDANERIKMLSTRPLPAGARSQARERLVSRLAKPSLEGLPAVIENGRIPWAEPTQAQREALSMEPALELLKDRG